MHGEVIEVVRLTPSMVRVVLGGPGLDGYTPVPYTDQYVNALFVPDGAPYAAPFDEQQVRELPAEHRPRGRRYTIRSWDAETRTLAIDFVVHGDVGHAGRWANQCVRAPCLLTWSVSTLRCRQCAAGQGTPPSDGDGGEHLTAAPVAVLLLRNERTQDVLKNSAIAEIIRLTRGVDANDRIERHD